MDMNKTTVWMTGLLVLALSACSSDSTRSSTDTAGGTSNSGSNMSGSGSAGVGDMDGMDRDGGSSASAAANAPATPQISYGTVQAIDPMVRQDVGLGAVGAAAVGGSMGSPTDKVYRVTARMDDGSSQMVVVDTMPSYKTGDRVRYSKGTLEQY